MSRKQPQNAHDSLHILAEDCAVLQNRDQGNMFQQDYFLPFMIISWNVNEFIYSSSTI